MKQTVSALLLFAFGVQHVTAATLYIPFLDPQPVTADIEGVDASGHTTWRIGPGVPSGTLTDDIGLFTSATLVEGATDAHLVEIATGSLDGFAVSADCGISGGIAVCIVVASGNGIISTDTATETASGFDVQLGAATATGAPTASVTGTSGTSVGTSAPGASGSPAASAGSGAGSGSGAAPTGSGTTGSEPSSPTSGNGAGKCDFSVFAFGMIGTAVSFVTYFF
ncbi:hypothetical protein BV20DRAFT_965975 [Pilatotrama ljubarskyi]|nr:hypothetical protein BV20DRAFT_965975 [Pilatotrama ljubarskyi]